MVYDPREEQTEPNWLEFWRWIRIGCERRFAAEEAAREEESKEKEVSEKECKDDGPIITED